jgi:hypothetical protein
MLWGAPYQPQRLDGHLAGVQRNKVVWPAEKRARGSAKSRASCEQGE